MLPSIRPAALGDLSQMVALLVRDAEQRRALDPVLWALPHDAPTRIEKAVRPGLEPSKAGPRELWLVAHADDSIVGISHAMLVPVPPIYGVATVPGLFLDDCFTAEDAPSGTAEALQVATEAALRTAGASSFMASCPAAGPWRPHYERRGYEPVTLYMAKGELEARAVPPDVRPAAAQDIPAIVKLSARHRSTLAELNPRFWSIHPEADSRFDAWMRYSLTLKDRDMLVAGPPGEVRGYIIAQPVSPLLVPAAHDISRTGVIDDFYDRSFAEVSARAQAGAPPPDLLSAAEAAFARHGFAVALAVCPAAWTSKLAILQRAGYRTAKLWMLKR